MFDLEDGVTGGVSGQRLADALTGNHRVMLAAQAAELVLAASWADVHNEDSLPTDAHGRVLPGMERAVRLGADGTPRVAEFATAELGALLGVSKQTADHLVRDGLDLRHRHRGLWARLQATAGLLEDEQAVADPAGFVPVPAWQARKVAQACHAADLDAEQAGRVDAATSPLLGRVPWGRLEKILAAAIIEADPEAAAARAQAAAQRRYVAKTRSSEHGLATLIIHADAGQIALLYAVIDRIAQILALDGDPDPLDVRRAKAAGILANPYQATALLLKHARTNPDSPGDTAAGDPANRDDTGDTGDTDGTGPGRSDLELLDDREIDDLEVVHDPTGPPDHPPDDPPEGGPPDPDPPDEDAPPEGRRLGVGDLHPSANDADDPCPTCAGTGYAPPGGGPGRDARLHAALLQAIRTKSLDPAKLLPAATLYVHLSGHALHHATTPTTAADRACPSCVAGDPLPATARVEGDIGAILVDQVTELLGHRRVDLKPVIDPTSTRAVDGYEVPDPMAEALYLRNPASAAPYSASLSRRNQKDHTRAYRRTTHGQPAAPGQTRLANLGQLETPLHRVKTHALGWRHHQPLPGIYLWRTRHGYWYRVDNTGTHPLGKHPDLTDYGIDTDDDAGTNGREGTDTGPEQSVQ